MSRNDAPSDARSDAPSEGAAAVNAPPPAPLVVVLSGPSGAGKDTVLRGALERDPSLATIVTAKTRPARPREQHGVHHLFLSEAEFDHLLGAGGFLEHAEVYGHRSGVPRDQVVRLLEEGRGVLIRTDIQGARSLKARIEGAVLVFITVPDRDTLELRLRARNTDSERDRQQRLDEAADEMAQAGWFDHVIVNRDGREAEAVDDLLTFIGRWRSRPDLPRPRL